MHLYVDQRCSLYEQDNFIASASLGKNAIEDNEYIHVLAVNCIRFEKGCCLFLSRPQHLSQQTIPS